LNKSDRNFHEISLKYFGSLYSAVLIDLMGDENDIENVYLESDNLFRTFTVFLPLIEARLLKAVYKLSYLNEDKQKPAYMTKKRNLGMVDGIIDSKLRSVSQTVGKFETDISRFGVRDMREEYRSNLGKNRNFKSKKFINLV